MSSNVEVIMTAEAAGLLKELINVVHGQDRVEKGLSGIAKKSAEAKREQEALGRLAKKVNQELATDQQRYNARVADLQKVYDAGKISAVKYAQGVQAANQKLRESSAAYKQQLAQEKASAEAAAAAKEKMGHSARRVYEETRTPQERYNKKLAEANALLKAGGIDAETYGRKVKLIKSEFDASNAGLTEHGALLRSALSQVTSLAAGYFSVQGAIGLVRAEIETMVEVQKRAAAATMPLADAQAAALRNLGAETPEQREAFVAKVKQMSAATRVSETDLYRRSSAALSARGNLPESVAMRMVEESAKIVPEDTEAGITVAGGGLDLMKAAGIQDPEAALGLLFQVGQMARIVSPEKLARSAAPAVTGVMARGGTVNEAGALFAALTQGMADPMGEMSRTAAIRLAQQLEEALPATDTYKFDKETGVREVAVKGTGLKSTAERLKYLQEHEEARQKFIAGASFEAAAAAPSEQLLSGKGATADAYREFLKRMPTESQATDLYVRRLAVQRGGQIQESAALKRSLEAGKEAIQTADPRAAQLGMIREVYGTTLQDVGLGWAGSKIGQLASLPYGDVQQFAGQLRGESARLKSGVQVVHSADESAWAGEPLQIPLSPSERAANEAKARGLDIMIAGIEQANNANIEAAKKLNEAAWNINQAARRQANAQPLGAAPGEDR